ncbi:hypothetical protein ACFY1A_20965 [Streptomyces sp. NPDC001520]|uniref:hypothetical protein n=1 Tax=Streptomyces sp. NPDC001520 TaxID=3364581 RepID=UPI003681104A
MKLPGFRSGSTGRPAQTRRRDADLSAKNIEEATVEACRTDFVLGAEDRADFDARCRATATGEGAGE